MRSSCSVHSSAKVKSWKVDTTIPEIFRKKLLTGAASIDIQPGDSFVDRLHKLQEFSQSATTAALLDAVERFCLNYGKMDVAFGVEQQAIESTIQSITGLANRIYCNPLMPRVFLLSLGLLCIIESLLTKVTIGEQQFDVSLVPLYVSKLFPVLKTLDHNLYFGSVEPGLELLLAHIKRFYQRIYNERSKSRLSDAYKDREFLLKMARQSTETKDFQEDWFNEYLKAQQQYYFNPKKHTKTPCLNRAFEIAQVANCEMHELMRCVIKHRNEHSSDRQGIQKLCLIDLHAGTGRQEKLEARSAFTGDPDAPFIFAVYFSSGYSFSAESSIANMLDAFSKENVTSQTASFHAASRTKKSNHSTSPYYYEITPGHVTPLFRQAVCDYHLGLGKATRIITLLEALCSRIDVMANRDYRQYIMLLVFQPPFLVDLLRQGMAIWHMLDRLHSCVKLSDAATTEPEYFFLKLAAAIAHYAMQCKEKYTDFALQQDEKKCACLWQRKMLEECRRRLTQQPLPGMVEQVWLYYYKINALLDLGFEQSDFQDLVTAYLSLILLPPLKGAVLEQIKVTLHRAFQAIDKMEHVDDKIRQITAQFKKDHGLSDDVTIDLASATVYQGKDQLHYLPPSVTSKPEYIAQFGSENFPAKMYNTAPGSCYQWQKDGFDYRFFNGLRSSSYDWDEYRKYCLLRKSVDNPKGEWYRLRMGDDAFNSPAWLAQHHYRAWVVDRVKKSGSRGHRAMSFAEKPFKQKECFVVEDENGKTRYEAQREGAVKSYGDGLCPVGELISQLDQAPYKRQLTLLSGFEHKAFIEVIKSDDVIYYYLPRYHLLFTQQQDKLILRLDDQEYQVSVYDQIAKYGLLLTPTNSESQKLFIIPPYNLKNQDYGRKLYDYRVPERHIKILVETDGSLAAQSSIDQLDLVCLYLNCNRGKQEFLEKALQLLNRCDFQGNQQEAERLWWFVKEPDELRSSGALSGGRSNHQRTIEPSAAAVKLSAIYHLLMIRQRFQPVFSAKFQENSAPYNAQKQEFDAFCQFLSALDTEIKALYQVYRNDIVAVEACLRLTRNQEQQLLSYYHQHWLQKKDSETPEYVGLLGERYLALFGSENAKPAYPCKEQKNIVVTVNPKDWLAHQATLRNYDRNSLHSHIMLTERMMLNDFATCYARAMQIMTTEKHRRSVDQDNQERQFLQDSPKMIGKYYDSKDSNVPLYRTCAEIIYLVLNAGDISGLPAKLQSYDDVENLCNFIASQLCKIPGVSIEDDAYKYVDVEAEEKPQDDASDWELIEKKDQLRNYFSQQITDQSSTINTWQIERNAIIEQLDDTPEKNYRKAADYLAKLDQRLLVAFLEVKQSLQCISAEAVSQSMEFEGIEAQEANDYRRRLLEIQAAIARSDYTRLVHLLLPPPDKTTGAIQQFEQKTNKSLRPEQKELFVDFVENFSAFKRENEGRFPSVAKELPMGYGKTKVVIPLLANYLADGEHLPVIIFPEKSLETNFNDLASTSNKAFGKRPFLLKFNRDMNHSAAELRGLYETLLIAMENKNYIVSSPANTQSIRLKYQEILKKRLKLQWRPNRALLEETDNQLVQLNRILRLLDDHGVAIVDEGFRNLAIRTHLHYSLGEAEPIDREIADNVIRLYQWMRKTTVCIGEQEYEFRQLLQQPGLIASQEIARDITRQYIDKLCDEHSRPEWISELLDGGFNAETLKTYLSADHVAATTENAINQRLAKLPWVERKWQLLRGELQVLLPITLPKKLHEHYGPNLDNPADIAAKPYRANNRPTPYVFGDILTRLNFTLQMTYQRGVPKDFFVTLLQNLQQQALQANHPDYHGDQTKQQAQDLWGSFYGDNAPDLLTLDLLQTEHVEALYDHCHNKEPLIQYFLERELARLRIHREELSCNAINHADMYASVIAIGGTMDNHLIFHPKIAFSYKETLLTESRILQRLKDNDAPLTECQGEGLDSFIQQYLSNDGLRFHAVMDGGGLFTGISNHDVAIKLAEHFGSAKFDYILFYQDDGLCALSVTDRSIISLDKTDPDYIQSRLGNCTAERRFTYYDQDHCEGEDILQCRNAHGIATVDVRTTLSQFTQEVERLRENDAGQRITVAISADAARQIRASGSQDITFDSFQGFLSENKRKVLEEDFLPAIIKMIDNAFQSVLLKKPVKEIDRNFADLQGFFATDHVSEILKSYARRPKSQNSQEFLRALAAKKMNLLRSNYLIDEMEENAINGNLQSVYQRAAYILEENIIVSAADNMDSHRESEQEVVVERLEQQQNQHQETPAAVNNNTVNPKELNFDWLNNITGLQNANKFLKVSPSMLPSIHFEFNQSLLATPNFIKTLACDLGYNENCFYNPYTKPACNLLFYIQDEAIYAVLCCPEDADKAVEHFSQVNKNQQVAWIQTLDGTSHGEKPDLTEQQLQQVDALSEQAAFISGRADILLRRKQLKFFDTDCEKKFKYFSATVAEYCKPRITTEQLAALKKRLALFDPVAAWKKQQKIHIPEGTTLAREEVLRATYGQLAAIATAASSGNQLDDNFFDNCNPAFQERLRQYYREECTEYEERKNNYQAVLEQAEANQKAIITKLYEAGIDDYGCITNEDLMKNLQNANHHQVRALIALYSRGKSDLYESAMEDEEFCEQLSSAVGDSRKLKGICDQYCLEGQEEDSHSIWLSFSEDEDETHKEHVSNKKEEEAVKFPLKIALSAVSVLSMGGGAGLFVAVGLCGATIASNIVFPWLVIALLAFGGTIAVGLVVNSLFASCCGSPAADPGCVLSPDM